MRRRISVLVGGLLLVVAAIGFTFVAGMRAEPARTERRPSDRSSGEPMLLRSSEAAGCIAVLIKHVGRTSGRAYETPVQAVATEDGFVIGLLYGPNTDWLKNMITSGSAAVVHEGSTYQVVRPEVVPMSQEAPRFPAKDQRTHRLFRVEQALLVRRAERGAPYVADSG